MDNGMRRRAGIHDGSAFCTARPAFEQAELAAARDAYTGAVLRSLTSDYSARYLKLRLALPVFTVSLRIVSHIFISAARMIEAGLCDVLSRGRLRPHHATVSRAASNALALASRLRCAAMAFPSAKLPAYAVGKLHLTTETILLYIYAGESNDVTTSGMTGVRLARKLRDGEKG